MAQTNQQITRQEPAQAQTIERARQRSVFAPPVDIVETPEEIILRADMPGTREDSLDITVENGVLTLRGEGEELGIPESHRWLGREYRTGDYERVFSLSEEIDQEKIEASYRNGVVTLRLPKAEPAKPRKIKITQG